MNDNQLFELSGKFALCEFDGYSFSKKKRVGFEGNREISAGERDFLQKSFKEDQSRPVIVLSKKEEPIVILPALAFNFSVVLKYFPATPFSLCDLRTLGNLRAEIAVSPAAYESIKRNCGDSLDFTDRISRLLNINGFLARGAQFKRNSHDIIDMANSFAENLSFLCGASLSLNREYPEVTFPEGYDFSVFGLILISALCECDTSPRPRLSHVTENGEGLFADLWVCGENRELLARALAFADRLNLPMSVERVGKATHICFSSARPDVSFIGVKQPFCIGWDEQEENIFEFNR